MKFKRLFFLFLFVGLPSFATYQNQGFSQFQNTNERSNFLCSGQCFFTVAPFAKNDFIVIDGHFQGSGSLGYGVLLDGKIFTGESFLLHGNNITFIKQAFSLKSLLYLPSIPTNTPVIFFVDGIVTGTNIHVDLHITSLYQNILPGWKDFWHMETLEFYTMNRRYGVKVFDISIVQYGYIIFLFVLVYILFMTKGGIHKKFRKMFFWGIGLFLFIGIRNIITYMWIVDQGIKNYVSPIPDQKMFFSLGAYYSFTDKVIKALQLDTSKKSCTLYIDFVRQPLFVVARKNVYFKPCVFVLTGSQADYIIYYERPIALSDSYKPILVQDRGSYLIANTNATNSGNGSPFKQ